MIPVWRSRAPYANPVRRINLVLAASATARTATHHPTHSHNKSITATESVSGDLRLINSPACAHFTLQVSSLD